jgi:hypothetical protein
MNGTIFNGLYSTQNNSKTSFIWISSTYNYYLEGTTWKFHVDHNNLQKKKNFRMLYSTFLCIIIFPCWRYGHSVYTAYYLCLRGSKGVSRAGCSALPAVEMDADLIWPLAERTGSPSPTPMELSIQ